MIQLQNALMSARGWRPMFVCSLVVCSLVVGNGCSRKEQRRRPTMEKVTTSATQEQLLRGMDRLTRVSEFDREQALGDAAYKLNRWLAEQEHDATWEVDPMTERLPRYIRDSDLLDGVAKWTFSVDDVRNMQEAVLLRDLATWISQQPANPRIESWLDNQTDAMGDLERENLLIAERLFDWTIRNIQLEVTPPYPEESVAPSPGGEQSRQKRIPAPQQAIPGPGYRFAPWEILQYGYGDALQRTRIFIELARQQGIDVVYLALPGNSVPPRPRPWVAAAFIDNKLYLFDCELGLPIPGPDGIGIATLDEVLAKPELLTALAVDDTPYRFKHDELKELIALIDVSPMNLSQRTQLVEANLAGDQRTIFTVSPTPLAEELKALNGIDNAVMWSVPFETIWFEAAMKKLLQTNREVAAGYYQAVGIFQTRGPLTQGRQLHLQGHFGRQEDGEDGAKALYLKARVPTAAIDQIGTSEEVQKALGLVRGDNEGDFVWESRLRSSHLLTTQAKQHSSYWLGLCHFETGNYKAAATWFEERTLDAFTNGPWTSGAKYNLARSYEALGKTNAARDLYSEDDSPQAHGNKLRAKLLKQWAAN